VRLLIIGDLNGQFSVASKIATERGAKVRYVNDPQVAVTNLREGHGADAILIDVKYDIRQLVDDLNLEHIYIPIIACGFNNNTKDAVNAIKAGAKEYLPLPPNEELIAAILGSITQEETSVIASY
jgi:DNA-binding NtrC family response regulator